MTVWQLLGWTAIALAGLLALRRTGKISPMVLLLGIGIMVAGWGWLATQGPQYGAPPIRCVVTPLSPGSSVLVCRNPSPSP
jgi:hypothetical protein